MRSHFVIVMATVFSALACRRMTPGTPLALAAATGDEAQMESLLRQGADAREKDPHGWPPLVWAARAGHDAAIRALVAAGADPNDPDGTARAWTPLLHAIHKNQSRAVVALLEGGADYNRPSLKGLTPLIMAAAYGQTAVVELLLAAGADPRHQTAVGLTALSAAVAGEIDVDRFTFGDCQTDTVQALLRHAPDLDLPDNLGSRLVLLWARAKDCRRVLDALGEKAD
jgi:hypothetical protein